MTNIVVPCDISCNKRKEDKSAKKEKNQMKSNGIALVSQAKF
jgi:hypothetical protein